MIASLLNDSTIAFGYGTQQQSRVYYFSTWRDQALPCPFLHSIQLRINHAIKNTQ